MSATRMQDVPDGCTAPAGRASGRERSSGQIVVLFAGAIVVLMGLTALVIDVSWYWANTLRLQRAADAAALAGAVWLPGQVGTATSVALLEATKNGYTDASAGVRVVPQQDSVASPGGDPRQLNVTVTAPVGTFFMRALGINSISASRTSKAVYVKPVPMGSPQNYYGVYKNCSVSGTTIACAGQPDATNGAVTLASQGFFGAVEGQGANRGTGDAFATGYDSDPTANAQYDPEGYDYQVTVPVSGATVYIWDPTFCPTTSGPGGGHLGAGDHWLSTTNHNTAVAVSTYFRLWDTHLTPFTTTDDTLVTESGTLFKNEFQVDKSAAYATASGAGGQNNNFSDGTEPTLTSVANCAGGAIANQAVGGYWHNKWWPMATNVAAGTYRLQITTTDPANPTLNQSQAFENMWSIEVAGSGSPGPTISGSGKMVTYANIETGTQVFYLAQIDRKSGAGKTVEIDLFDPGDVGDKAWLQILSPDGNAYNPVTFSYTADANATAGHTSGTNVNCIQTYANSSSAAPPAGCTANYTASPAVQYYQNSWIQILIALPASYGSVGLTPTGEPAAGWWKIKYTVNKGNDTTTWMVSLRGNPVRLVVP